MSEHAILQPSSAHRWVECPGSVQAQQVHPGTETEATLEGTAAHWVGEQILSSYQNDSGVIAVTQMIDDKAPNGVIINEDMAEAAALYVMDVLKVYQEGGHLSAMRIEQRVSIDRVHDFNWGTPDCTIWSSDTGVLHVWDFKFGRTPVDNVSNWQLIEYGIGAIDEVIESTGLTDEVITVHLHVVQPRAYHVEGPCRTWTIPGSDLRAYANQLKVSANQSMTVTPPTKAGKWCEYCTASHTCMTLQRASAKVADRVETMQLHDLSPENSAIEIRYLQRAKKLVEERLESLEGQALEQAKKGVVIPGFSIGNGRGSTAWIKSDDEVIALGDLMGIQLRKKETPITPKQAMKLNIDEKVINSYSEKCQGAARLVATDQTIVSRIFSK